MHKELWLLTVAPASRVAEVEALIDSIGLPKERNVVVAHSPDFLRTDKAEVIDFYGDEFNISKWWDLGLDYIADKACDDCGYDILVIESDVRISREDVDILRINMRMTNTVMAGADWQDCLEPGQMKVRRDNSKWIAEDKEAWQSRLPGMGVVIAGEANLRHDPLYPRFWFADDHLEWKARENGGTLLVGGTTLHHNGTQGTLTGDLKRFAEEDDKIFTEYWGGHPGNGGKY